MQNEAPPEGRPLADPPSPASPEAPGAPPLQRRATLQILLAAAAPGVLAGVLVAGLLFFLNPDLPFKVGPVGRAAALYGGLLAAASLLLHLPFTSRRPRRARRALPWTLTAVLACAALLDWAHAAHFAYFLPPGINERLLKAGLWLTLAALLSFYTALLHSLHQRLYGPRTRVAYVLLALASVYVQVERREAFRTLRPTVARPLQVDSGQRPQLLVVGIESATLDAILPLAEQGRLPFFRKLLYEGTYARLGSLTPTRRTPLWATLATGKYPYKHGLVGPLVYPAGHLATGGELRLLPRGLAFRTWGTLGTGAPRPTDTHAKKALAVWELLDRLGMTVDVVGWPAAYPLPAQPRRVLSEPFFDPDAMPDAVPAETARPPELAERARLFRVAPDGLDPAFLSRFGGHPPREALGADLWRGSLSLFLLEQRPAPEALFVLLPGLAEVSATHYGGYAAVQFEGVQQPLHEEAALELTAYYAHLDDFLARAWGRLSGPRLLAVVSAHGVEVPGGWRQVWAELSQRRSLAGRHDEGPDGVFLLLGDGVRAGSFLREARLVDLVPTLLYSLGFPVARDLDGKVLTAAFAPEFLARRPLTFLPSYETLSAP